MTEKAPIVWHILHTGIRLAKTKPLQIPGWIDDNLPSSLIADAWVGAQETFGALWLKLSPGVTFSPQVTNPYATGTKEPPKASPRPTLYLTRIKKSPQARKSAKKAYTTVTFLHLTIPIAVQGLKGFAEAEAALFSAIHEIWEALLSVGPHKTHILPWYEPDQGMGRRFPSLRQGDTFPTSRNSMEARYVAEWKLVWFSDSTVLRFRLGHDKPIHIYMDHQRVFNHIDDLEATLIVDKLQTPHTATAVWLGGPAPQQGTLDMIEDILLASPCFKKHDILMLHLQADVIHTARGQLPRTTPHTKAIHAVCAAKEKSRVCKILKLVYPSAPACDYPQGLQLRAIENTADPDFPVPRLARAIASQMRTKQQNFLKSICVTHYDHFKNIHSSISHPENPILSQLLYNWRSADNSSQQLFLMVEQDFEDCPTKFSYLASLQDEASAILPVLPLILVGRLGQAAQAWFLPLHTLGTTDGYRYDDESDRIVPTDSGSNLEAVD
jgi:hypothetical protein